MLFRNLTCKFAFNATNFYIEWFVVSQDWRAGKQADDVKSKEARVIHVPIACNAHSSTNQLPGKLVVDNVQRNSKQLIKFCQPPPTISSYVAIPRCCRDVSF